MGPPEARERAWAVRVHDFPEDEKEARKRWPRWRAEATEDDVDGLQADWVRRAVPSARCQMWREAEDSEMEATA